LKPRRLLRASQTCASHSSYRLEFVWNPTDPWARFCGPLAPMWTKLKPPVNREWRHVLTQGFYIIGDAAARSGGAFGANCADRARGRRFELLAVPGHIERGDFDTITPTLLRVIKRMVCLRQQLGHVECPLHAVHQADADCTAYRVTVDLLRHLGKGLANALRNGHRLLAVGIGEHRGKFLTAKPADEIGSTHRLARRLGEDFQHA